VELDASTSQGKYAEHPSPACPLVPLTRRYRIIATVSEGAEDRLHPRSTRLRYWTEKMTCLACLPREMPPQLRSGKKLQQRTKSPCRLLPGSLPLTCAPPSELHKGESLDRDAPLMRFASLRKKLEPCVPIASMVGIPTKFAGTAAQEIIKCCHQRKCAALSQPRKGLEESAGVIPPRRRTPARIRFSETQSSGHSNQPLWQKISPIVVGRAARCVASLSKLENYF
jgi:hypothetical protein